MAALRAASAALVRGSSASDEIPAQIPHGDSGSFEFGRCPFAGFDHPFLAVQEEAESGHAFW